MPKKDSMIAAGITFAAVLAILLFLFTGSLKYERSLLAINSIPEIQPEDTLFIQPEILRPHGEENAVRHTAPVKQYKGGPQKAPVENTKLNVPGKNTKPAPPEPKLNTTNRQSKMTATEPELSKEEKSKVTSAVAKGFSPHNGTPEGDKGQAGSGGVGMGIAGSASGRTFLGCPRPDVALRHKTTVKVTVVINPEGQVVSASASGGASAEIRRACEQAARGARWSEKKGASETRGTITFTITPR